MFTINKKPRKAVEFKELLPGATFEYKDDYYIRCDVVDDGVDNIVNNAVDLSTGVHECFTRECIVYPINLVCEVEY